jgi:hypothetical protein
MATKKQPVKQVHLKKKVEPKKNPTIKWREQWLNECAIELVPLIVDASGKEMGNFRISCGYPSRNALSLKRRVVGQCFNSVVSVSGYHELFISPLLDDDMDVAGTIAHELVHANVGTEHGHRKPFIRVVRAIGLDGKPTATVPGELFKKEATAILKKLGPYPHDRLTPSAKHKAQPTRLIKAGCAECGYVIRVTQKWIEKGLPICPMCNEVFEVWRAAV